MELEFVDRNREHRLLLIFAGWGMDTRPFQGLTHQGYSIAVAYNHVSPASDEQIAQIRQFEEICILAWSFGVIAATRFITENSSLPMTAKCAVNGTLTPVSDTTGIPSAIFNATLENLSEASLMKFNRRMCGSRNALNEFQAHAPQRSIQSLDQELRSIARMPQMPQHKAVWDKVIIGTADNIIPTANQQEFWQGHPSVNRIESPHLPDFSEIVEQMLISKPRVAHQFEMAAPTYDSQASIQQKVATELTSILAKASNDANRIKNIVEIGPGTGTLTQHLTEIYPQSRLTLIDIAPISPTLPGEHIIADAEVEIMKFAPNSIDIITGTSAIQWFNSPATFLERCYRSLREEGIVGLSTFGPDTFSEISQYLSARLDYRTVDYWQLLLKRIGFKAIEIRESRHTMSFASAQHLLRHIKETGANALSSRPAPNAARQIIGEGISSLTYHPIIIVAKK